jgi:hypothetical protein
MSLFPSIINRLMASETPYAKMTFTVKNIDWPSQALAGF